MEKCKFWTSKNMEKCKSAAQIWGARKPSKIFTTKMRRFKLSPRTFPKKLQKF